jgi:hypothetical protein
VTLRPEAVQARLLRLEEVISQLQELGDFSEFAQAVRRWLDGLG